MIERLGNLLFWLGIAAWIAMITTVAIAAMHTFPTLRDMPMTIDAYASFDGDPHGLLAAGHVMRGVFITTDYGQLIAAVLSLTGAIFGVVGSRHFSGWLRGVGVVVAIALLGTYWLTLRGDMHDALDAKWAAAAAGDLVAAATATDEFDGMHQRAEQLFRVIGLVVLITASTAALLAPVGRPRRTEDDE